MPQARDRPCRIVHVYGALGRGGAETWLMDVVRRTPRDELQFDVCLTNPRRGAYEDEFVRLGGQVHRCPIAGNLRAFARRLREILQHGQYDIVHSHLYHFTGFILRVAARAGVPQRIAHIHPAVDAKARSPLRALYTWWMRRWILRYGTHFVGPTRASLEGYWGPDWESDGRKRVIYNGIAIERFHQPVDRTAVRRELDLPDDCQIVLNVARYAAHKRHAFLVQVAETVAARHPNVYFVLIGAGDLKRAVEEQVCARGLTPRFRFIEGAPSIDRYWLSADVFAFPSSNEGFGIVVAEAAAAGLRVVAQDIPGVREAATACPAPVLLPLETPAADWAAVLLEQLALPRISEAERQMLLKHFPFTIENSIQTLRSIYDA
jgi:glycosyltransferase involved in cell wall biosynthesis